ncbi:hypothetical protein GCM10010218_48830 [Streptomyces mashuensis]|uniref:Uncharacterized protein n=1 Tax=Streptomyces mashuensis TaxID=33904 RepID=A0A919EF28_9ACTN|nr:hypothetical protein GCM10010218_48830 [Streptomyces mashuensis]
MWKTLKSGLQVNPLGRCAAGFCSEPATVVTTFISRYSTVPENPLGYCSGHVERRFVDDETYDRRHQDYPGVVGGSVYRRSDYEIREPNETEAAELAWEQGAEERWKAEGRIGEYRRIAELHAADTVDGMLVDAWTAGACVALHDALSEKNRERWLGLTTAQQCDIAVRLTMGGR